MPSRLDVDGFLAARGSAVSFVRDLLSATFVPARPARVLRPPRVGDGARHRRRTTCGTPAGRCGSGSEGTDAVVERHGIRCSHFDAYRFFTDSARPRNALRPTRETQVAMEQPGCLHAGMDISSARSQRQNE